MRCKLTSDAEGRKRMLNESGPRTRCTLLVILWVALLLAGCASEITDPGDPATGGTGATASGGSASLGPPLSDPCLNGSCGCAAGFLSCAGTCTEVRSNPSNCGACGKVCSADQICDAGSCKPRVQGCSAGLADCGGACVDLKSTAAHCGVCNAACPATQTCSNGSCVCPSGKLKCGESCVDASADNANCGVCGNACAGGQVCQQGSCACAPGQTACAGACVNTQTDNANCGACGTTCGNGTTCNAGVCSCGAGKLQCGMACIDVMKDDQNCGACGAACSLGQGCVGGTCGGGGVLRDDACQGLAQNLTLRKVSVYQTIEIPIMKDGMEVPAAMRNTDVVTGRDALVRVFATLGEGWSARELSARLFIDNGGEVKMFHGKATLRASSTDADLASTFQIQVPKGSFTPDSKYAVEVVECAGTPSGTATTARFPATSGLVLGARDTGVLKIHIVPMQINSTVPDTSEAGLKVYKDRFLALYPVSDVQITVREPVSFPSATDWTGNLDRMRAQRRTDAPAADVYYYGLLKPVATLREFCGGGCTTGIGYVPGGNTSSQAAQRVSLGIGFADNESADTMAHEIAHNHGRNHAPCGSGISGVDQTFPYENGRIGVYGYDAAAKRLIPPDRSDLMGYCNSKWMSDYTYDGIMSRVAAVNMSLSELFSSELEEPWDVVLLDANGPRWGVPIDEPSAPAGEAEPAEILDAAGQVITVETVYRTEISDIGAYSFEVPQRQPGWKSIRVSGAPALAYP